MHVRHARRELRRVAAPLYTESMAIASPVLTGKHVRLEPLEARHVEGLVAAAAVDPSLYHWSPVPQGTAAAEAYVAKAHALRDAGTAIPFATVRVSDGAVIGSTRFWQMERWAWPEGHARLATSCLDVCEIGWTWLTRDAVRTAANTEAKFLMLTHAFEQWQVLRVNFCTDARNERSAAAIERIGGKLDGKLRSHRMAADFIPRDSLWFSILRDEWPGVKEKLQVRLG
jgi:RimJ/RimL family protein N-acetyltransferase